MGFGRAVLRVDGRVGGVAMVVGRLAVATMVGWVGGTVASADADDRLVCEMAAGRMVPVVLRMAERRGEVTGDRLRELGEPGRRAALVAELADRLDDPRACALILAFDDRMLERMAERMVGAGLGGGSVVGKGARGR